MTSTTTTLLVMAAVGIGSYAFRFVPLLLVDRMALPPIVERGLRYAGPAALTALAIPMIVSGGSTADPALMARVLAVAVAIAVAARTRSLPLSVAVGLPVFWAASALVSVAT